MFSLDWAWRSPVFDGHCTGITEKPLLRNRNVFSTSWINALLLEERSEEHGPFNLNLHLQQQNQTCNESTVRFSGYFRKHRRRYRSPGRRQPAWELRDEQCDWSLCEQSESLSCSHLWIWWRGLAAKRPCISATIQPSDDHTARPTSLISSNSNSKRSCDPRLMTGGPNRSSPRGDATLAGVLTSS